MMCVLISVAWCMGRTLMEVFSSSVARMASMQLIMLAARLAFVSTTPLLAPVVPLVKRIFAGASRSSSFTR